MFLNMGELNEMREKRIIFLMLLMISLMIVITPRETNAASWEYEENNYNVLAGHWLKVYDPMVIGDVISGFFETHSNTQGLDFFICDSANLALWEASNPATIYQWHDNYHYLGFEFTVTSDDTWYTVFSNREGSSTVTADIGMDLNGDSTPSYTGYDHIEYGITIEPDGYYALYDYYGTGSTISGDVSTWFSTDGIDVFFCDASNYAIFTSSGTPTIYGLEDNVHISSFGEFTVPYADTWYVVFSAVGQADTVTISLGMDYEIVTETTTSESTSTTEPQSSTSDITGPVGSFELGGLGFVIIGAALIGLVAAAVVCSRRRPGPPPAPGAYEVITPSPGPRADSVERPTPVSAAGAKVLVICPYCGAKTEQGILACQNCGADL